MHIDIFNTFLCTIIIIKLTSIGSIFSKTIQEVNLTLGEHHKVVKTGNEVKAEIDMWIQVSTYIHIGWLKECINDNKKKELPSLVFHFSSNGVNIIYNLFTPRYGWNSAKVGVKHQSINQQLKYKFS